MIVTARAQIDIAHPRPSTFEYAVAASTLPLAFVGYGLIPAIRAATLLAPGPLASGQRRRIENSDGSVLIEEVLAVEQDNLHRYRIVSGLKPPFSLLVRWGESEWRFLNEGTGTRIEWRYDFALTTPLVWPFAAAVIRGQFQGAMQRCLDRLKARLEATG